MKTDTWRNTAVIVTGNNCKRQQRWEKICNSVGLNNQRKLNATTIYIYTSCGKSITHKAL